MGKWRRRYFVNETEAIAFADARNASSKTELNGDSAKELEDAPRQNGFKPGEGAGDQRPQLDDSESLKRLRQTQRSPRMGGRCIGSRATVCRWTAAAHCESTALNPKRRRSRERFVT